MGAVKLGGNPFPLPYLATVDYGGQLKGGNLLLPAVEVVFVFVFIFIVVVVGVLLRGTVVSPPPTLLSKCGV